MVLSASPLLDASTASLLLNQTAIELTQDQHLIRIKKLVFYLCTETWETDRQRLDRLCLRLLLQHLLETASTLEALQQQLNRAVSTLNKTAEYTIVANLLISRLHPVYAANQQDQQAAVDQTQYQTLAQQLEQTPDAMRIKKLLLLACRSTWENNTAQLKQLHLTQLLQELHQIAPTVEAVRSTLHQVAQALSKPEVYTEVAETIATAFHRFDSTPTDCTQLKHKPDLTQPIPLPPLAAQSTQITTRQRRSAPAMPAVDNQAATDSELVLRQLPADLFDLRLAIMQDTNPFKVKILLFSLLHEPFQWQHEAMLKTHEIDDLLRVLLLTYRLYTEATGKLRQVAQLLGAEHYAQAAEAVLRGIEIFYDQAPVSSALKAEQITIDPTQMKPVTHEMTRPDCH